MVLVLAACSIFLVFRISSNQAAKRVELLPFTGSRPAWDGSYPYLIISPIDPASKDIKFKSSIRLIKPTVRHDSPMNEFQVDLHSGLFVLRQTDLFISDVNPLALTRTYRPWGLLGSAFGLGSFEAPHG